MTEPLRVGSKLKLPDGTECFVYSHSSEMHRCGKITNTTVLRSEAVDMRIEIETYSTGKTVQDLLTPKAQV